ncbi:hypothetical protein EHS25_003229 [Saitozyma podzolica]|uniref:DASH complex subunit DAD2 n=1 Tax=Saitozyma podzolica TaxID=1890683 RepID=A0A427Y885_9TREE|nr:hypothetical protein EHS25_003229 [Saitozyma podzolica]
MSRPGSLPASQASGLAGTNLTPSLQTLLQKQQEHAGLQALREASAELLARVEKLAEMSNVMADGGEAIGDVLKNWPHVFSILNLFEQPSVPTSPGGTPLPREDDEPDEPLPQLVRLHYNVETEDSAKR